MGIFCQFLHRAELTRPLMESVILTAHMLLVALQACNACQDEKYHLA